MSDNRPISEQWHEAGLRWADAEAAAQLLEETKTAALAELIAEELRAAPGLSHARAETNVKSSPEWRRWIEGMVRARKAANRARIDRDFLKMRFSEWVAQDANHRAGARM